MTTTIQRKIAKDVLVVFMVALFVLTAMVMMIGVAREALSQGLGLVGVMRLLPYALPNALSLSVPGTALLSVCTVYGRMSADREFVALQSVGISPLPAMTPAIALTTLLSLGTVGLINLAFTWGYWGVEHVVMSSVERIAYGVLERDHRFQHGDLSMSVRDVEGEDLIEPVISIHKPNGELVSINARVAKMRYTDEDQSLTLQITEGQATFSDKASFVFPDTLVQKIPLGRSLGMDLLTAHPSHMPMRELPAASIAQTEDVSRRVGEIVAHTGFSLINAQPNELIEQAALDREEALRQSRRRVHRLGTEMHRRWASGFTCLALAMVGVPLAIRMKTTDTMTTFGIVFLPTLLVYYPIFALTLDMAKDGRLAAQGVWIANLVFVLMSLLMMRRIIYRPM
ncbi:LptF/LptG family permease [Novipirellula artificiosorum]|uniref:Putative permease YjgP/YjgQ family protein n=1 Tax=Novipirellula artificiosorum TaxID=2528016 RepID=A0A5C6DGA3_9BACT|nr:LptF/LptG family permease [Novipirellula artificiosorum]TWU35014.1 putative permease YjgP/YjgQ family protein [Novipirellula artificiosorum]